MLINFSIFQRIFILKIPKHIGLIPDGNRRGTIEQGLQKHEGYSYGLNPGLEILRFNNRILILIINIIIISN